MELTQLVFFVSLVCFSIAFATIFLVGGYNNKQESKEA
tara:strand:- start:363 stop:476 length:114 start_codon:yes stop_codon:yes gene_type:complete